MDARGKLSKKRNRLNLVGFCFYRTFYKKKNNKVVKTAIKKMKNLGELFLKWYLAVKYSEKGATAVEYAIMASLIAAVIVLAVTALGQKTQNLFETVKF